ncbi:hypothetical protein T10_12770 [Trichinella papuae]|uniref:PiggyBac transposable element-derived protein 4 C-terminal zinc-ribbon domain-containing protein n=1 Tax=Trichinella papuae TaxID=268474 RepID=A0A0V1MF30_9BILA|nr:hypothetical protein T10_12770 [Trichinella papuae]
MDMLDMTIINSYVLYKTQFLAYHAGKNQKRKLFIKDLGLQMVKLWIERRMSHGMTEEGTSSRAETTPTNSVPKRGGSKDRKTLYRCATCNRFICQVHTVKVETRFCTECPVTHEE